MIVAIAVRFENGAIVLSALIYLVTRKQFKTVVITLAGNLLICGVFFALMVNNNLPFFSSSVADKSAIIGGADKFRELIQNLQINIHVYSGVLILAGVISLLGYFMFSQESKSKRSLASTAIIACIIHLVFGRCQGLYDRYETYILNFLMLTMGYIYGSMIPRVTRERLSALNTVNIIVFGVCLVAFITPANITGLFSLHIAANNIYEQQHQMYRFATEYVKGPVAVNDIGRVSYQNANYVLDLYGLAYRENLMLRCTEKTGKWMNDLTVSNKIRVAMIYKDCFNSIPQEWVELGSLKLGKRRITAALKSVTFFATGEPYVLELNSLIDQFVPTLPRDVIFSRKVAKSESKLPVSN
jgi:hypothetical protein